MVEQLAEHWVEQLVEHLAEQKSEESAEVLTEIPIVVLELKLAVQHLQELLYSAFQLLPFVEA